MAWQLIYTSAPRGLAPGQSGFCTVARSPDLREGLAQRLEQLSSYEHSVQEGAHLAGGSSVISAYRILDLRGARFHVLTRIVDAGLDFTSRTNHLAHHLIFEPWEIAALPNPAALLLQWAGWRSDWNEEPRFLLPHELANLELVPRDFPLPAVGWQRGSGDAGAAAGLLEKEFAAGVYLLTPPGGERELIQLYAETLQLLCSPGQPNAAAWQQTFTSFLQGTDNPSDFRWRGCQPGSPAFVKAVRNGITPIAFELIAAPNNDLSYLARNGKPVARLSRTATGAHPPTAAAAASKPLALSTKTPWAEAPENRHKPSAPSLRTRPVRGRGNPTSNEERRSFFPLTAVATVALLLVVIGGFRTGGWFGRGRTAPSTPPLPTPILVGQRPNSTNPPPPAPGTNESFTKAPIEQKIPPLPRVIPPGHLARLEAAWDNLPTWIAFFSGDEPVELGVIPPLDKMFGALLRAEPVPILASDIECTLAVGNQIRLNAERESAIFDPSLFTKVAQIGSALQLEFDKNNPKRLLWRAKPASFTSCVFKQAAGKGQEFDTFRLVFLNTASMPQPMSLPKSLLLADQTSPLDVLLPPLRQRHEKLRFIPQDISEQFDPYKSIGPSNKVVACYDDWRPAAGNDLQYSTHRSNLQALKDSLVKKSSEITNQILGIRTNLLEKERLDFELGKHAGLLPTNRLYSFATYCTGPPLVSADRDRLILYLKEHLKERSISLDDPANTEIKLGLANPSRQQEALRKLQAAHFQTFTAVAIPDYWVSLERPDNIVHRHQEKVKLREALRSHEESLKKLHVQIDAEMTKLERIPQDMKDTYEVRLFLQSRSRSVEFIRFDSEKKEHSR